MIVKHESSSSANNDQLHVLKLIHKKTIKFSVSDPNQFDPKPDQEVKPKGKMIILANFSHKFKPHFTENSKPDILDTVAQPEQKAPAKVLTP